MLTRSVSALLLLSASAPAFAASPFCNQVWKGVRVIPAKAPGIHDHEFESNVAYIEAQDALSAKYILKAADPKALVPEAHPGSLYASPSTYLPGVPSQNYRYYWKRDGALVAREIYHDWGQALARKDQKLADELLKQLLEWVDYCRLLQATDNASGKAFNEGVMDPKFELSGQVFWDQWIRHQSDGPALEAVTQMLIARKLLELGRQDLVRDRFYNPDPGAHSVIGVNLDVVRRFWRLKSGNVWEDKKGFHYYNRLAQWDALTQGADFVEKLGDADYARALRSEAAELFKTLDAFYDAGAGYLRATIEPEAGYDPQSSLDAEVLLATLHSAPKTGAFSPIDDRVLQTIHRFVQSFKDLYAINRITKSAAGEELGIAVGRYSEDIYDGYTSNATTKGNPWFLTTLGMAELHFIVERSLTLAGSIRVTERNLAFLQELGLKRVPPVGTEIRKGTPEYEDLVQANRRAAARYIQRVKYHAGPDGHLSEQFNRDTGYMQGVEDLTWSHAAIASLKRAIDALSRGALISLELR